MMFLAWILLTLGFVSPAPITQDMVVKPGDIVVVLWHESPNDRRALEGLKIGLEAAGLLSRYRLVEVREDEKAARQLFRTADEVGVALVVTLGTRATQIAKSEIKRVPIIFSAVTHPILSGLVTDWGPSGTLLAGNSNWLDRKSMFESFRAAVPELKNLLVLTTRGCAVSETETAEAVQEARRIPGFELIHHVLEKAADAPKVIEGHAKTVQAVWIPIDIELYRDESLHRLVAACVANRLPIVSTSEKCAGAGALLVVAVDYELLGLRAAALVKAVVKDRRQPGELPIGRTNATRTFVDLGAAQLIGRTVPIDIILRAHRVFGASR